MNESSVYEDVDVRTLINAAGTRTRVSGPRMRKEAAEAMREAADKSAHISELQAAASRTIQDLTGSEAGYVASGSAACLTLAAAACIARSDPGVMSRLPNTGDAPNEIVMPRMHRHGYDHALRAAGAEIIDVGNADYTLGWLRQTPSDGRLRTLSPRRLRRSPVSRRQTTKYQLRPSQISPTTTISR